MPPGRALGRGAAATLAEKQAQSQAFFGDYAALLGLSPQAVRFVSSATDRLGETHLTWRQYHGAVPVFGAVVKTHFDRANQLKGYRRNGSSRHHGESQSVNRRSAGRERFALHRDRGRCRRRHRRSGCSTLYVYRSGLAQGVPGENHLAWEVEITNGADVRELVYVDAHSGKIVNRTRAFTTILPSRLRRPQPRFVPQNYPSEWGHAYTSTRRPHLTSGSPVR